VYGPLIKCGISLREIRKHTPNEIIVMLKSLERRSILEEGSSMKEDMLSGHPELVPLYGSYLDEIDKFKKQREKHAPRGK
jgi:hypothetical protein